MPKAVVLRQTGGPEQLQVQDIAEPKTPKKGQVLLRHTAIGVNFMDIYYRSGIYKAPRLPMILGIEACGVIEKVGEGLNLTPGQRVAYCTAPMGAYCQKRLIDANHLIGVPDNIPDEIVAAALTKAMTAHYLLHRTFRVAKGDTILVHAAAGGTGGMLSQWANNIIGANVIGTVGSREKINTARNNGCNHVISYRHEDFAKATQQITDSLGVKVVYDSVGKDTFNKSLDCLMPFGLMVSYGQSSGPVPAFNVFRLAPKSLFLTRPMLNNYKKDLMERTLTAIEIFKRLETGDIKAHIYKKYPLEKAQQAHKDIESRASTGAIVLIP